MNAASVKSQPVETGQRCDGSWSRGRWWLAVGLVFAAHIGFIFAFSDRKPVMPRPSAFAPTLKLVTDSGELLALDDPTLFALPHRKGSAGATWLQSPVVQFQPFRWTELPRLLPLPVEELGSTFARLMQTNVPPAFELETKPVPEFTMPVVPETAPPPPARPALRIAGGLANRPLLNPPGLRSWSAMEVQTNTVAQLLVNAVGDVMSATLLPPGSGSKKADQWAMDLARTVRFAPLRSGTGKLTVGALIFEWRTLLPRENSPSDNP